MAQQTPRLHHHESGNGCRNRNGIFRNTGDGADRTIERSDASFDRRCLKSDLLALQCAPQLQCLPFGLELSAARNHGSTRDLSDCASFLSSANVASRKRGRDFTLKISHVIATTAKSKKAAVT